MPVEGFGSLGWVAGVLRLVLDVYLQNRPPKGIDRGGGGGCNPGDDDPRSQGPAQFSIHPETRLIQELVEQDRQQYHH